MIKKRILVVDDEPDVLDLLQIILENEGYQIEKASDGIEALDKINKRPPDLLIVDFKMPRMDGGKLCARLRKDILLRHLPIIMLTGKGDVTDKVKGIDAGCDDYVVKPFDEEELLARIKMVLRRTEQDLDANPLTRLPGNVSILNEIEKRIKNNIPFAVCYIDLDKFKIYNDYYGFEKGDEIIKETARIIIKVLTEDGDGTDFIGHIGGDDFVIIINPNKIDKICQRIIYLFDKTRPDFYSEKDKQKGYLLGKDRQGREIKAPLISISIGVVTSEKKKLTHVAEVSQLGAELKEYAKKLEGSNYVKERRK